MRVSMTILLTCVLHFCYPVHCQNKQLSLSLSLSLNITLSPSNCLVTIILLCYKVANSNACYIGNNFNATYQLQLEDMCIVHTDMKQWVEPGCVHSYCRAVQFYMATL